MMRKAKRTRRTLIALEAKLEQARSREERTDAHFQLALFHDNNSREAAAVPHYRAALRLGLKGEQRAQALTWLASSFYKTGQSAEAKSCAAQALRVTSDASLLKFLVGLHRRIDNAEKTRA